MADEAVGPVRSRAAGISLLLAPVFAGAGVLSAVLSAERPSLRWVAYAAWALALACFGLALAPDRLTRRIVALLTVAGAVALTVGTSRHWIVAPAAVAAWIWAVHLLAVPWTVVLGAAAASMVAVPVAVALDARGASEGLAILAYGLSWLACITAAASRLVDRRTAASDHHRHA